MFLYPVGTAAWYALFHSVSAFCNAGFSTFDDSLVGHQGDLVIIPTIAGLIIAGGIGFPVMIDLRRNWHGPWAERWENTQLHTKLVLIGTAILVAGGTVAFLVLEWNNALAGMPWWKRILVAFFQAVVPRTAGFNSVEIGALTPATLFLIILLMIIGAAPCSTGGGFKVSTMMVLALRAWTSFQGRSRVSVFRRTIPPEIFAYATTTILVYGVVACLAVTVLLVTQQADKPHTKGEGIFLDSVFEVVSAMGTVGLSTGLTPTLNGAAKLLIILMMFLGRLGPISVFAALSRSERTPGLEFPAEKPLIG